VTEFFIIEALAQKTVKTHNPDR